MDILSLDPGRRVRELPLIDTEEANSRLRKLLEQTLEENRRMQDSVDVFAKFLTAHMEDRKIGVQRIVSPERADPWAEVGRRRAAVVAAQQKHWDNMGLSGKWTVDEFMLRSTRAWWALGRIAAAAALYECHVMRVFDLRGDCRFVDAYCLAG